MFETKRRIALFASALMAGMILLGARPAGATDWRSLPQAKGLSSSDRAKAAKLMDSVYCYYGCSSTVSKCLRRGEPTARFLAEMILRYVKQGRDEAFIRRAVLDRAKTMHPFKRHKISVHPNQCTGAPAKAKVVVVAFSDFQCPFCTKVLPALRRIAKEFSGKVVLCFKHFPTQAHGRYAVLSSQAAVAAAKQGKFWALFDVLYKHRTHQSPAEVEGYARSVGLDMARFRADRDSRATRRLVALDKREGLKLGVKGTPTLFIDGKMYHGRKDTEELRSRIAEELMLVTRGR